MSQFIESIKVENGNFLLLNYHQQRIDKTFAHFGHSHSLDLKHLIENINHTEKGLFKLRIVYDLEKNFKVELIPYLVPEIKSFELVENHSISYDFKFLNREILTEMKNNSMAQEIIIVKKRNITDTSFSNLLFLKDDIWYTPKNYLLNGVQRQNLLEQKKIKETEIHVDNIKSFSHFQLINSMNTPSSSPIYPINKIINL